MTFQVRIGQRKGGRTTNNPIATDSIDHVRLSHCGHMHLACLRGERLRWLIHDIFVTLVPFVILPCLVGVLIAVCFPPAWLQWMGWAPIQGPNPIDMKLLIAELGVICICIALPIVEALWSRTLTFTRDMVIVERSGWRRRHGKSDVLSLKIHRLPDREGVFLSVEVYPGGARGLLHLTALDNADDVAKELEALGYDVERVDWDL